MRLAIFGASGRTGRRLVEQALHAGYHLTAVVRDPARLPVRHDRLQVLAADLLDATAIQPAVASADAVATDDHGTTLFYRLLVGPLLRALLRRGYADMAAMEDMTRRSGTAWTILRSPGAPTAPDRDLAPGQGRQSARWLLHLPGRLGRRDPGQPG
jgi:NAD(P)-dependent dehydrogenase (short-subunit alcohol dehydrogenase family)